MCKHITMFKYSADKGHIRCVIGGNLKADFEDLGFVDHIDKVEAPKPKAKRAPAKATKSKG